MSFVVPVYVRRLLEGDQLERAEGDAESLGVRLRDPPRPRWLGGLQEERLALAERLAAAGADPLRLSSVVEHLAGLTKVGGPYDPLVEETCAPWLWLLARLLRGDRVIAAKAAREWYRAVDVAGMDAGRNIPNRTFVAHLAGVLTAHALEDARAEHWLMLGEVDSETHDEDPTGPFLQAVRWVRTALRS